MNLPTINAVRKLSAPTITPQALAWDGAHLWMSSRDLGTLYKVDAEKWEIAEEIDPPGIIWAGVATKGAMHFTIGKGLNDDRYVYSHSPEKGFSKLFACPDFQGSYLSHDGKNLYLSQWYKGDIHQLDRTGKILRTMNVGAEICGHVFVDGAIYVLRGTENVPRPAYAQGPPTPEKFRRGAKEGEERWWIARLDPREDTPTVEDLAIVPFASRSLTFDGKHFWSNHRAANETVVFDLPV